MVIAQPIDDLMAKEDSEPSKQRDLQWNEFLQSKIDNFGDFLAQQHFPPPELRLAGGYNRALLIGMALERLRKDADQLSPDQIETYIQAHNDHREGKRFALYLRLKSFADVDEIGEHLVKWSIAPARLRVRNTFNRQMIITLALCYVADLIQTL